MVGGTYKIGINPDWNVKRLPCLVGFWSAVVVPTGILWSFGNNKMLKILSLPKDPIGLTKIVNKKFIIADLVLNHGIYQIIITYTLNLMFGLISYDK